MTKTEKITKSIEIKYINNNNVKSNDKLPTIRTLMEEFSVSSATLTKCLNILEEKGLIKRLQGGGIFVNKQEKKQRFIGLVGLSNEYEIMISYINGVKTACGRFGYNLMLGNFYSGWNYKMERDEIKSLIDRGCEGIILIPIPRRPKDIQKDYLNKEFLDFPITLLDTGNPKLKRIQVTYNYKKEGYDLTKYFINLGYKNIYILTERGEKLSPNHYRKIGFQEALNEVNLFDENKIIYPRDYNYIKEIIKNNKVDVLICYDDTYAKSLNEYFKLENITNIKLAGFDNLNDNNSFITTDIDETETSEFAVEVLIKLMTKEYDNNYIFMINSKVITK